MEILSDPKVNSQSSPSPVGHSFLETLPALGCQDWSLWVFLFPWEDCPAQLSWWFPFPCISSSLWNASKDWSPPLFPLILLGISIQANGFKKHCPEMAVEIPDHLSLFCLLSLVGSSICISNTPYLKQNSWLSPLTFSSPRTFHLWKWQLCTSRYLVQKPWSHHWLFLLRPHFQLSANPVAFQRNRSRIFHFSMSLLPLFLSHHPFLPRWLQPTGPPVHPDCS